MDGSGYPKGLAGDAIMLEARILMVSDVVEAIASHRPYRPALGIDKALEEIEQKKGVRYDADVVEACLNLFREKGYKEEYDMPIAGIRKEVKLRFGKYWDSPETPISMPRKKLEATKGEKQRARIMEKAIYLFSVKGYHSTHIAHITDALNISKATFYLYFKNKEDLFINIFEHLVMEITKTEEKISGTDDLMGRMRERVRTYFSFYKRYYRIFEIIRAESIGKNTTRVNIKAIYKLLIDKLLPDFIKAGDTGMVVPIAKKDPQFLTLVLFGAFDFMCYSNLIDLSNHSADDFMEFASALIIAPEFDRNHG